MVRNFVLAMLATVILTVTVYTYFRSFVGMNESPWKIYNIPAKGKTVLVLGDGIAARFIPTGTSYTFQDISSPKETAAQTLEKLAAISSKSQPDIILFSSGAYESEKNVDWSEIADNNAKLLKNSIDLGAATLFVGVYPPKAGDNFPFSFRSNCKKFGAFLLDDLFSGKYEEDIDSTISHITPDEKAKIASHIERALDKLSNG